MADLSTRDERERVHSRAQRWGAPGGAGALAIATGEASHGRR